MNSTLKTILIVVAGGLAGALAVGYMHGSQDKTNGN